MESSAAALPKLKVLNSLTNTKDEFVPSNPN
jgi:hypothetical protein